MFVAAPILSDDEIEAEAFLLVQTQVVFFLSLLSKCGPMDKVPACKIDPFVIANEMGLTVNRGKTGRKLGHIDITHKKVTLSSRVKDKNPKDRYSMAHEIGHNIFHSRVSEKAKDGVHAIVSNTKKWLEHHANYFASCLLMPAPIICRLYDIYWKKEFQSDKVCPIHVNTDYYNDPVFQRVVGPIARKMSVSLQAAYIRLRKLGLILDET